MNYTEYNTLILNGQSLHGLEITQYCRAQDARNVREIGLFMNEWMSDNPMIEVQTSGSTGSPKIISVEKNQMLESAAMTADYFGFSGMQTALLCLPMSYIAGKMMVVRALVSRLDLICVEPDSKPLEKLGPSRVIDFAPLVPMQLHGVTDSKQIRTILLGGAPLDPAQENNMQRLAARIYHGYGMTETLSHVALREVNGPNHSEIYTGLQGVHFDIDERNCLVIDAPFLSKKIYTNDVVDLLNEREFIWRGRVDFVVNSGGIKLFPEEIERKIFPLIRERFFLAGLPDERFGEKLSLFIEGEEYEGPRFDKLLQELSTRLDKYEKPRDIFFIPAFKTTESGKLRRAATVQMVLNA